MIDTAQRMMSPETVNAIGNRALYELETALAPLECRIGKRIWGWGCDTKSGVAHSVWGVGFSVDEADFALPPDEFYALRLGPAVTATAAQILRHAVPGAWLETMELDLPGGLLLAHRTTGRSMSLRLTCGIFVPGFPVHMAAEELSDGAMEIYDAVRHRKVVVSPPFRYEMRIEVLGGFSEPARASWQETSADVSPQAEYKTLSVQE